MIYAETDGGKQDIFFVKSSGEGDSKWFGLVKADNDYEACISILKELFSQDNSQISLGLFMMAINISKIHREEALKANKKPLKHASIYRTSEILADANVHHVARLYKMEEDAYIKKQSEPNAK